MQQEPGAIGWRRGNSGSGASQSPVCRHAGSPPTQQVAPAQRSQVPFQSPAPGIRRSLQPRSRCNAARPNRTTTKTNDQSTHRYMTTAVRVNRQSKPADRHRPCPSTASLLVSGELSLDGQYRWHRYWRRLSATMANSLQRRVCRPWL